NQRHEAIKADFKKTAGQEFLNVGDAVKARRQVAHIPAFKEACRQPQQMLKRIDKPYTVKFGSKAKNHLRSHCAYCDSNNKDQGKGYKQNFAYPKVAGCQDPVDSPLQIKRRKHLQKSQQQSSAKNGKHISANTRYFAKKTLPGKRTGPVRRQNSRRALELNYHAGEHPGKILVPHP